MGVTIQEDMYEAAQYMPESHRGPFIAALVGYGLTGELPDESEPWYPTFYVCKSRLDMSAEASIRNREAGIASGRARRKRSSKQDTNTRSNTCSDDSGTDAQTDVNTCSDTRSNSRSNTPSTSVRTEVRKGEVRKGKEKGDRALKRFTPPSPDEVAAYAKEQCLNIDPVRFCDYYESCGWVVGRNRPMKDWKAAARRWSKNEYGDLTQGGDPDDYYDFSALDRRSMGDVDADLPF